MTLTRTKGAIETAMGTLALVASVFVLPLPLYGFASGVAQDGLLAPVIVGLALLAGGVVLLCRGLLKRSRDLRVARTYDSWEPTASDLDRPGNPHQVPSALVQLQQGG